MGSEMCIRDRSALVPPATLRALAGVVLLLPQIPMLFMGEEWGAKEPFLFFCDFDGDLAAAVREGRRREFARFPEFADPDSVARIPDPLAEATFLAAKLDWTAIDAEHLAFTREALAARRKYVRPLIGDIARAGTWLELGERAVRVAWTAGERRLVLLANLGERPATFAEAPGVEIWRCGDASEPGALGPWSVRWSLE